MSVILITNHNESIYNLSQSQTASVQKKAKGEAEKTSVKRLGDSKKIVKKEIKSHGVMGIPKQPPPDPRNFLKKGTGKPLQSSHLQFEEPVEDIKPVKKFLPPVPARDEVLKETADKIVRRSRNCVVQNIKRAVSMPPKIPVPKVAITVDGVTRELSAGLEPKYVTSKEYGKIPPYLDNLIKIRQSALESQEDKKGVEPKCMYINKEERENLLKGLKENWEELQRVYQGLPILTDTIPKILRKSKLESELKQLEKDIVLIERHPYIYVYEDENDL